ncbi:MAG: V-type ATP synthase subunit E [candidate division WOR-3 bacterium]
MADRMKSPEGGEQTVARLVEKILADARAQVAAILREKEHQLSEMEKRKVALIEQLKAENAKKVQERTQAILDNARSRAELERKKILLQARWRIIDSVCQKAKEMVLSRPDYLALVRRLIEKNAQPDATIHLSIADTARFNPSSPTVRIGEPLPISGGVIIQHGKEKIDLSLDTVLSEARDDLIAALNRILFFP